MPPYIYQILHITGIVMVFIGFGAMLGRVMSNSDSKLVRVLGAATSGTGLLLMLVAGFALISKKHYSFDEPWLRIKLVAWVALAIMTVVINRVPQYSRVIWWILIAIALAATTAVYYQQTVAG